MLSVGHSVTDDILEKDLEDATCLLVDQAADSLDSATPGETANGGLGDSLDVVAEDLTVSFCSSLA